MRAAALVARSDRRRCRGHGRARRSGHPASRRREAVRCLDAGSCRSPFISLGAGVRLEGGTHGAVCVMEPRTSRAGRYAECLGDLRRRVSEVVVEHEDRPLFGRQPTEPAFQQVPVGDREQFIGSGRSVGRQDPKVRGFTTLARRMVDADVDEEALEPRIEAVRIAEARRSRQAITSASCRASSARSISRRIRWAVAKRWSWRTRIRSTYAARSPFCAASMRSPSTACASSVTPWMGAV